VTLRPPLDGVDGGGLLVGTEVAPRGATGKPSVSASTTPADGLGGDGGHVHPHRVLGVVAESQVHRVADDVRRHVEEFAVVRRLLRGLLQRREVVAGPQDERLGLGNVGDAEHRRAGHPGLEDAGGRAAGAVDDRATAVDRREERALGGRGEVLLAGDGAAVDADRAGDAHRHLDRADHVLDGGLGGLRGKP